MAGKPIMRANRRIAFAIDHLSKNTLADMVLDRILAVLGEENVSDEAILYQLQNWSEPVSILRGDKPINFLALAKRFDRHNAEWKKLKELTSKWPDPEADGDDIPDEMRG